MRCLLAQLNTTPGDVEGNLEKALNACKEAAGREVDLLLLPEMTLPGYPCKDLLTFPSFLLRCQEALRHFALETLSGPPAIIGFPEPHQHPGHGLYNSAAFCRGGRVEAIYRKKLLPTYDVYEEGRYFDSHGEPVVVELAGRKVGITICEDIWNDPADWQARRYASNPISLAAEKGSDVIVNISASPFTLSKQKTRREFMGNAAVRYGVGLLVCNLAGANDDLIFDGFSTAISSKGEVLCEAEPFEEAMVEVELAATDRPIDVPQIEPMELMRRALVCGVRDYFRKSGFKRALVALSGGIDSAVVAVIAAQALGPDNVEAVSLPSRFSSEHSRTDAEVLAQNLGISYRTIPIEEMFAAALNAVEPHFTEGGSPNIAVENLQSRLRGAVMMTLSNASGALVLSTGNKSEAAVGYATLYGDMCGALAVIADVLKTEVYDLARHINRKAGHDLIPENTITKPPSAELAPGQKDSDTLPAYDTLDAIIRMHMEEKKAAGEIIAAGYDKETVQRVLRLLRANEYKRYQSAPVLKVSEVAFGPGWKMPIAGK